MGHCPHFEALLEDDHYLNGQASDELKQRLLRAVSEGRCISCGKGSTTHLCLSPQCLYMGCGRSDKGHALEHFRVKRPREEHCLALDLGSLSVWCYECDDFITSRTTGSVFEFLESAAEQRRASKSSPRKEPRAESQQVPSGHAGLHNLGNTCYMNAALQVMLNWYPLKWPYTFITMPYSQPIRGYFGECSAFVRAKGNRPLSQAFLDLFDAVQDVGTGERGNQAVSPRTFVREIKAVNPAFEGYTQQDTMDFMRTLWDRLHEELGQDSVAVSDQSANQRRKSNRLASSAGLSYTAYSPRSQSIVSDTFGGILRSRIDCLSCKAVSIKEDPFLDLSLPIVNGAAQSESGELERAASPKSSSSDVAGISSPKSPALEYMGSFLSSIGESLGFAGRGTRIEACLAGFCSTERLEGKDRYYCERCKAKVPSLKTLSIQEPPNYLVIQLKRFKHESFFSSKVNTHVSFPVDGLDLYPFLRRDPQQRHSSPSKKPAQKPHPLDPSDPPQNTLYDLVGVINHLGSFSGGHYTAYCRGTNPNTWLKFDDSYVAGASVEDVTSSQAYCLLYKRRFEPRAIVPCKGDTRAVSRQWMNRFRTLADPGPLCSADLVCAHSKLRADLVPVDGHRYSAAAMIARVPGSILQGMEREFGSVKPECMSIEDVDAGPCPICIEEERALDARRKEEAAAIHELDSRSIDSESGEQWHLIDTHWLTAFLSFRDGLSKRPPGPISNDRLIGDGNGPRKGLLRGVHYRAVNPRVWQYLLARYGGGPAIPRPHIDIYSTPDPGDASTGSGSFMSVSSTGSPRRTSPRKRDC